MSTRRLFKVPLSHMGWRLSRALCLSNKKRDRIPALILTKRPNRQNRPSGVPTITNKSGSVTQNRLFWYRNFHHRRCQAAVGRCATAPTQLVFLWNSLHNSLLQFASWFLRARLPTSTESRDIELETNFIYCQVCGFARDFKLSILRCRSKWPVAATARDPQALGLGRNWIFRLLGGNAI